MYGQLLASSLHQAPTADRRRLVELRAEAGDHDRLRDAAGPTTAGPPALF